MFDWYLLNKTQTEVQLLEGTVRVPIDGWTAVTKAEIETLEVVGAVRKGWIEATQTKPKGTESPFKPAVEKLAEVAPNADGSKTMPAPTAEDAPKRKAKEETKQL
jgi:hypothetical protein